MNKENLHPGNWDNTKLRKYLLNDMKWSLEKVRPMSKEEMVDAILRDEIDKE